MLVRVVRLTIETNTFTGIFQGSLIDMHLTSSLAALAITSLVLFFAFPVSLTNNWHKSPSHLVTFFKGSSILYIYVCSLGPFLRFQLTWAKELRSSGKCE